MTSPPQRALVMGVLNITPDSFSDGGRFSSLDEVVLAAEAMKAAGADWLDVGGESTRPGADPVSPEEEARRVLPVIQALQGIGLPLSLDSRRPPVVEQALAMGIQMVNDVTGFTQPEMRALVPGMAKAGVLAGVMHMQGEPKTMQQAPQYGDVVAEVRAFLARQQAALLDLGLEQDQILLDPGFGFGKRLPDNLALMRALPSLLALGPVLVGVSRKRMIAELTRRPGQTSDPEPASRLAGSLAAAVWAAGQGATMVRVHDVAETVDALQVALALESAP